MSDKNEPMDESIQPKVNSRMDPRESGLIKFLSAPGDLLTGLFKSLQRENPDNVFYHKRYRRVPGIETCHVDDAACIYEANKQFERDRRLEREIMQVLSFKLQECRVYYLRNRYEYCADIQKEYDDAATNFFIKYGDLPAKARAQDCLMKQKHRMIWERRHGPVGTGMKSEEKISPRPIEAPKNRQIFGIQDKYINFYGDHGIRIREKPVPSD